MVKLRSFRIRIALLSAVLAGGALVGFGLISWWLIYEAKVSRLDAELESQLMRAGRPRSSEGWQSYETSLGQAFGTNGKTAIAILVIGADGNILYRSQQWATDLDVTNLWTSRPQLPPFPSPRFERQTAPFPAAKPPFPERLQPPPEVPPPTPRFATQHTTTGTWRVGAVTTPFTQVAIAVSLNAVTQEMAVIRNIFLISIPGVLLLVAGGAWGIAGSSLHSIRRLTTVIGNVTASGLEQRVPIGTTDVEFVELIQVFNQMLERLERSFKQASRFSGDAAHELKTPLAILQGELERTLQQAEPGSQVQQRLSNLLDEVRRLSGIVRKLLLLSLADAGQMNLHRVEVDLSGLLMEMLEDIELLAPHLEIQTEIADALCVQGDHDLLIQVLQNLISNAIKYNLPNGWIRIDAHRQGTTVSITISNCSKDIAVSDQSRIFDRFHRGDPARTRKVEGIGLGLSLAREIARAHGGDLTLDSPLSGQTAFTLTLPVGL
ncbi:sensor histidine kinase [Allocoleopsis franciscana]|uniref:histidine kinase n=1 Tax=Allocoleopsis franciscana PCC 7113 TaxID=1173027 RepID=K9WHK2_9CYAN|nr:ATP-binding protein [Allocoleopsis franciscana]AFZ19002.1 signal transduction histidine kinase [Allocoleopsis franciscana PCC 7113]